VYTATRETGSLVINIKNRVAKDGSLRGQRHPYVFQLVLALQNMGWRWIEEYVWQKPNAIPGKVRSPHQRLVRARLPLRSGSPAVLRSRRRPGDLPDLADEIERRKQDTNVPRHGGDHPPGVTGDPVRLPKQPGRGHP